MRWIKDWLNWFTLVSVAFIISELYMWNGVLSIDLIPAAVVMVSAILVVIIVIGERRWKAFKEFRGMVIFNGSGQQKFKQLQDYVTEEANEK